jgi:hypothetical protein
MTNDVINSHHQNELLPWLIYFPFPASSSLLLSSTARIPCPFYSSLLWLSLHMLHPKLEDPLPVHPPFSQQCLHVIIDVDILKYNFSGIAFALFI